MKAAELLKAFGRVEHTRLAPAIQRAKAASPRPWKWDKVKACIADGEDKHIGSKTANWLLCSAARQDVPDCVGGLWAYMLRDAETIRAYLEGRKKPGKNPVKKMAYEAAKTGLEDAVARLDGSQAGI